MFLSDLSIRRPVFAAVLMLVLLTLGVASYRRLSVDLFPCGETPVPSIATVRAGAPPAPVDRAVSKPIEDAPSPIAGVRQGGSISREGLSQVWVVFHLEKGPDDAAQQARCKLAAI